MMPSAFDETGAPLMAQPALRIRLFGDLTVEIRGRSLPELARQPQTGGLLAFLALHPFRSFPRLALAERLWPDLPPERAAGALRAALYRLRRRMGAGLDPRRIPVRAERDRRFWTFRLLLHSMFPCLHSQACRPGVLWRSRL